LLGKGRLTVAHKQRGAKSLKLCSALWRHAQLCGCKTVRTKSLYESGSGWCFPGESWACAPRKVSKQAAW